MDSNRAAEIRTIGLAMLGVVLILALAAIGQRAAAPNTQSIQVVAGTGQNADAEAVIVDMFSPGGYLATAAVVASSTHVATSTAHGVTTDLYTYDSVFEDRGAMRCVLSVHGDGEAGGAGAGCPSDAQLTPHVGVSYWSSGRVGERATDGHQSVYVAWADGDAQWMIVTLRSGDQIRSNVVDGYSLANWRGGWDDDARSVHLTDSDGQLVWSKILDPPPPPPGA